MSHARRSRVALPGALPRLTLLMLLILGALALLARTTAQAQSPGIEDLSAFPRSELTITHAHRVHRFAIWIANTPARQEQGLMFVRSLPPAAGMLFPMGAPRVANFWMKNTYVALDMVFIGPDHRIVRIAANTVPFSLDLVSSGEPVAAVLEIAGGEAQRLGIAVGDRADWKAN